MQKYFSCESNTPCPKNIQSSVSWLATKVWVYRFVSTYLTYTLHFMQTFPLLETYLSSWQSWERHDLHHFIQEWSLMCILDLRAVFVFQKSSFFFFSVLFPKEAPLQNLESSVWFWILKQKLNGKIGNVIRNLAIFVRKGTLLWFLQVRWYMLIIKIEAGIWTAQHIDKDEQKNFIRKRNDFLFLWFAFLQILKPF